MARSCVALSSTHVHPALGAFGLLVFSPLLPPPHGKPALSRPCGHSLLLPWRGWVGGSSFVLPGPRPALRLVCPGGHTGYACRPLALSFVVCGVAPFLFFGDSLPARGTAQRLLSAACTRGGWPPRGGAPSHVQEEEAREPGGEVAVRKEILPFVVPLFPRHLFVRVRSTPPVCARLCWWWGWAWVRRTWLHFGAFVCGLRTKKGVQIQTKQSSFCLHPPHPPHHAPYHPPTPTHPLFSLPTDSTETWLPKPRLLALPPWACSPPKPSSLPP